MLVSGKRAAHRSAHFHVVHIQYIFAASIACLFWLAFGQAQFVDLGGLPNPSEPLPVCTAERQRLNLLQSTTLGDPFPWLIVAGDCAYKLSLFRCSTTSCLYADISAGRPAGIATDPSSLLYNKTLFVATNDQTNSGKPALIRCLPNGTSCVYFDISAGQGSSSGRSPFILVDKTTDYILVVTQNNANSGKPSLFRCSQDGVCSHSDISAGQPANSGGTPSAFVDLADDRLLVVTSNAAGRPSLFHCLLNGSACVYADLSAGQGDNCALNPVALLNAGDSRLLVVATDASNNHACLFVYVRFAALCHAWRAFVPSSDRLCVCVLCEQMSAERLLLPLY